MNGKFVRIYGDSNQPKYIDHIPDGRSSIYIYYDDNHNIVDEGKGTPSLIMQECLATHKNSSSICKKLYLSNDISISECSGYAKKKFHKSNISYKSFHNYYKFGDSVYYENKYFFEDGEISFAMYKKI
jgi:hypothetical protein